MIVRFLEWVDNKFNICEALVTDDMLAEDASKELSEEVYSAEKLAGHLLQSENVERIGEAYFPVGYWYCIDSKECQRVLKDFKEREYEVYGKVVVIPELCGCSEIIIDFDDECSVEYFDDFIERNKKC